MLTKGERRNIWKQAGVDIRLICLYVDGCWCITVNRAPFRGAGVTCVIHIFQDRAPARTLNVNGIF